MKENALVPRPSKFPRYSIGHGRAVNNWFRFQPTSGMETEIQKLASDMTKTDLSADKPNQHWHGEERAMLTVTCLAAFLFFNSFGKLHLVRMPLVRVRSFESERGRYHRGLR